MKLKDTVKSFFRKTAIFIRSDCFKLVLGVIFVALSLVLMLTRYFGSLERMWASVKDLGSAFYVYFLSFYMKETDVPSSVMDLPTVDLQKYIWFDLDALVKKVETFPEAIFDKYVFTEYNIFLIDLLSDICLVVLQGVLLLLVPLLLRTLILQNNDKPAGTMSRPYKAALALCERCILPFLRWCRSLYESIIDRWYLKWPLVCIWFVNLNLPSLLLLCLAFYIYFCATLDVVFIVVAPVKLLVDIIIMLWALPWYAWTAIFAACAVSLAFSKGYAELRHMESKNCGFLQTTSYIVLIKGEPGLGKTTLATDMGLSWENIHKADALEIMMAMEMLFPAFSFQSLRQALNEAIDTRQIFCVPACDKFVDGLVIESPAPYLYNTNIFATERNTGTSKVTLDKAIRTYAKAYWIYSNDNSTMANYPIRFDGRFDDSKHLKKWNGDFFKRHAIKDRDKSRYAHILDQDVLRQGKKMDPDNKFNGTFGYGIYVNTEWGKSRGNKVTTEEIKKTDEQTNQKNDLYSYALKMCRHANSTIWHQVFFRFIGDEQRPESLAADQRELCSIIDIADKSELKLALPCAGLLDKLYEGVYEPFKAFYLDYLNKRSDMILSVYLMKFGVALLSRIYRYLYNTFGYYEMTLALEKGSNYGKDGKESEVKTHVYYLMCKKVYSDRYNTDCHSSYFTKLQMEAELGIRDYPTFDNLRMTVDEMKAQHDYFINEWLDIMNGGADSQPAPRASSRRSSRPDVPVFDFDS